MNNDKMLSALSLARKAGKLAVGFDSVKASVETEKAKTVLLAQDISSGTSKRIKSLSRKVPVLQIKLSQWEISKITGKCAGVLALTDENFARLCRKVMEGEQ
jgi:ribosomal protein L7Ae-like RNA K-turn-binding protein